MSLLYIIYYICLMSYDTLYLNICSKKSTVGLLLVTYLNLPNVFYPLDLEIRVKISTADTVFHTAYNPSYILSRSKE